MVSRRMTHGRQRLAHGPQIGNPSKDPGYTSQGRGLEAAFYQVLVFRPKQMIPIGQV